MTTTTSPRASRGLGGISPVTQPAADNEIPLEVGEMAKGKYASRATGRREAADADASEAAYRRQIVRITQERDEARAALAKAASLAAAEARLLRAQVAEGTSDLVEALRREANRLRADRDARARTMAQQVKVNEKNFELICAHMISEHGALPGTDAMEQAFRLVMNPQTTITVGIETAVGDKLGPGVVHALRRARGQQRRSA